MPMRKFRWPWQKKTEQPQECAHKYKDFPWYREAVYYTNFQSITFKIYEPFVCVLCGHRVNKVLMDETCSVKSKKDGDAWIRCKCEAIEDRIQHRAIVEDMIADMQLVDRRFLELTGLLDEYVPPPKIDVPQ